MKYLIQVVLILISTPLYANVDISHVLSELDRTIKERNIYIEEKERRIDALKFSLKNADNTIQKSDICHDIFNEYKYYQYDSAYLYATKCNISALTSNIKDDIAQSECNLLFCFSTIGYFKEGGEIISNFRIEGVSKIVAANYYEECFKYYNNSINYLGTRSLSYDKYKIKRVESIDKLIELLDTNSFRHKLYAVQKEIYILGNYESSIPNLIQLLNTPNLSLHNQALLNAWLGLCYEMTDESQLAIYHITLSAIADIKSCTFDTTSARLLAQYMFDNGDIVRANRYINLALEDANFYNSQLRRLETLSIMPTISAERYDIIIKNKRRLIGIFIVILFSSIIIMVIMSRLQRVNLELKNTRHEVESRAQELSETNLLLKKLNEELNETNRIKDIYIIESLYGDSNFVNSVEKMCKLISRKIKAKQFTDLLDVVSSLGIKHERQRMASAFDSAFLKLFPNFIDEYNKLFHDGDAVTLSDNGELPTEVRVFALIRLGVDDASKIAHYLNLSLNTIYVYKAKVKARSIVAKDEFEDKIRAII